ncbi:MAG TPA: C45 family autoproteolytic acyltransferase/hydrolase [Fulvivirga sp.]|nr:C45 family autoproteolytic acyltransferase/hydrolase [Fulvivirga sp.]
MKLLKKILVAIGLLIVLLITIYYFKVRIVPPEVGNEQTNAANISEKEGIYRSENGSWLKENDKGLWEMYIQGTPYESGVAFGALAGKSGLMAEKEAAFVSEIKNKVPSPIYLNFLKYMVGWLNRDLDDYVPHEYLLEIYGSSKYMPDEYDYIAPKFHRALSYHAAHDIGHALQNMNLVGCTSFATWNDESDGNKLLIGRNFDFYFGQDFAKDKIVAFYKPDSGYQFMSVTWACFSGVVSGMNEKGLTITLNSAKSAIPTKGKTPVSLIARQILQYAKNIDEALAIAEKHESFVAETFLIGSKEDNKVGLIEKTPEKTALFMSDNNEMVVTNHFQSEELRNDPLNKEYEAEGVSDYRFDRVKQMIDSLAPMSPADMVTILRNRDGLDGEKIGLSNEKAVNQLIAHHSVVFSPTDMIAWVSAPPYNLGAYVAYDLNEIFNSTDHNFTYSDSLSLASDPFLATEKYAGYENFMDIKERIQNYLYSGNGNKLTKEEIEKFIADNPNGFLTYYYLGDYSFKQKEYAEAIKYYEIGLTMVIARESERKHMESRITEAQTLMDND